MAALTAPECAKTCRIPFSCCEAEHCESTILWAKDRWGIELPRTNGQSWKGKPLPLMGPNGCTAAPHLRPICTVHTCDVNSLGCKSGDPTWTERYMQLRNEIDELELLREFPENK